VLNLRSNAILSRNDYLVYVVLPLIILVLVTCFVYLSSLTGPFLFDDFPNLKPLVAYVRGDLSWLEFVFGGRAGPTGRPLSLATFTLFSSSFPDNAFPFKLINLLIHLLNGIILYFLTFKALKILSFSKKKCLVAAAFCMGFWLLHPLNMSSVLLVIQRMNLLMTTFCLLAMYTYVHGRTLILEAPRKSYLFICFSFVLSGLSILAKENGALFPLYIWVMEITILQKLVSPATPVWRYFKWGLIYIPSVLIISYLIKVGLSVDGVYSKRDFTVNERLMTEARVIFDYLRQILIPTLSGTGIFHDDYKTSTSLFEPISTIISIVGVALALFSGLWLRRRMPILSFAMLFFLAGHLLESTVLNLELYFEHRNYLPMIGIGIALGCLFANISKGVIKLFLIVYLVLIAGVSFANSSVWGDRGLIAKVWATERPDSLRAQRLLVDYYRSQAQFERARTHLRNIIVKEPDFADLWLQDLIFECALEGRLENEFISKVSNELKTGRAKFGVDEIVLNLMKLESFNKCEGLTKELIVSLIDDLLSNKQIKGRVTQQFFYYYQGNLYAQLGNLPSALTAIDNAYEKGPNIDFIFIQVKWLIAAGVYNIAEEYLSKAQELNSQRELYMKSREDDIELYKQLILQSRES